MQGRRGVSGGREGEETLCELKGGRGVEAGDALRQRVGGKAVMVFL